MTVLIPTHPPVSIHEKPSPSPCLPLFPIPSPRWFVVELETNLRIKKLNQPIHYDLCVGDKISHLVKVGSLEYRLYGVIQDVVFTHQPHFSCSFLSLICLSTNQNIQLIHSLLIRIEWTTGNGILMSSSHWPIYNKLYPATN